MKAPRTTSFGSPKLLLVAALFLLGPSLAWSESPGSVPAGSLDLRAVVQAGGLTTAVGHVEGADGRLRALLVQYSASGDRLGTHSPDQTPGLSLYEDVAVAPSGELYAVGWVEGKGAWLLGPGVKVVTGTDATTGLVVKYSATGTPVWARVLPATKAAWLTRVVVDAQGLVHAVAADQDRERLVTWSPEGQFFGARDVPDTTALAVGPRGSLFLGGRGVVRAQDAQGNTLWTRPVPHGKNAGEVTITKLTAMPDGGVGVVGSIQAPPALLACRLNPDGSVVWSQGFANAGQPAYFQGVALGTDGSLLAVGDQQGTVPVEWAPGLQAGGSTPGRNAVAVSLGAHGEPLWTLGVSEGGDTSGFQGVVAVEDGFVLVGSFRQPGPYRFGTGTPVTGASTDFNGFVVKVGPQGTVLWTRADRLAP